ncbi:hypothetical protein [Massilia sp. erpn]|uniref:hypothetical protein n=1 Tax=Massilia sp. erpn TaxID=2738142 RepID=UPI002105F04B|nr:hypothetical protein [Massilia sp. erpn]UTY59325.1 hypothetical protein HPQ68_20375 [Massilia sp. erpn]
MKEQLKMHSKIQVEDIFTKNVGEKIFFVLACRIVAGEVTVGSNMSLPFSAGLGMTIPIDEIDVIGDQRIEIKVHCNDQEEIEFLLGLNLNGEALVVE